MYIIDCAVWSHHTSNTWWYTSIVSLCVVINEGLPRVHHWITFISSIECGTISKEVFDWSQNASVCTWFALNSFSVSFGILINFIVLLTHSFIVSAPLRIVTDCNCWSESVIKAVLLETDSSPVSSVEEVFRIVRTWETDVVREQNATCDMLISMNGISGKKWFNFVGFTIVCCNVNSVIELLSKFTPFI